MRGLVCCRGDNRVMSTEKIFDDPTLEALRKRYFPRILWTDEGPVRRRYLAKAEGRTVAEALEALALAEGFIAPGERAISGGPEECLAAMQTKGGADTLIFGQGLDVVWCDLAIGPADGDGWQMLIVRSEEAENLTALAHAVGAVRFKRM